MTRIKRELLERSNGMCENCGRPAEDDIHLENKQMGGRKGQWKKLWDDLRNRVAGCRSCHDLLHFRRMEMYPGERKKCWETFCEAADHESWLAVGSLHGASLEHNGRGS